VFAEREHLAKGEMYFQKTDGRKANWSLHSVKGITQEGIEILPWQNAKK